MLKAIIAGLSVSVLGYLVVFFVFLLANDMSYDRGDETRHLILAVFYLSGIMLTCTLLITDTIKKVFKNNK